MKDIGQFDRLLPSPIAATTNILQIDHNIYLIKKVDKYVKAFFSTLSR